MAFNRIAYLEWCRRYMGTVRHDLARSNVKPLTREEFPFEAADVEIGLSDEDGQPPLRKLLAQRYEVAPERVFVCNGATMGIFLACSAVLEPGDEVLIENPHYEPYSRVPQHLGVDLKTVDRRFERGWQIDLEELERRVSRRTKALLMTNLHNPSGTATNPDKMLTIGQIARDHGARVVCSEVYLDNAFSGNHKPAVSYGEHMISLGSLSKVYGLAGLKVGWIVAGEDVIQRIRMVQDYILGGLGAPSQALALLALQRADQIVARCRAIVQNSVKIIGEWMKRHPGVTWVEPEGGTVALLRLPPNTDALALSTYLREKHSTLVVPGDFFGLRGYLRVALGVDEEILRNGLKHLGPAIEHHRGPGR